MTWADDRTRPGAEPMACLNELEDRVKTLQQDIRCLAAVDLSCTVVALVVC